MIRPQRGNPSDTPESQPRRYILALPSGGASGLPSLSFGGSGGFLPSGGGNGLPPLPFGGVRRHSAHRRGGMKSGRDPAALPGDRAWRAIRKKIAPILLITLPHLKNWCIIYLLEIAHHSGTFRRFGRVSRHIHCVWLPYPGRYAAAVFQPFSAAFRGFAGFPAFADGTCRKCAIYKG